MSGPRILTPAYRTLIDELADRNSPNAELTVEQLAIVVRQYDDHEWDLLDPNDLHAFANALQTSADAGAREITRLVTASIQRQARHLVAEDVERELELRDLDDDRSPASFRHYSGLPFQGEF